MLDPQTSADRPGAEDTPLPWRLRLLVTALCLFALGVVLVTNRFLSDSFTQATRNRADLRLALYSGNILTELQRTSVVPLLLTKDPAIGQALQDRDFSLTSQRLIQIRDEIGVADILLVDDQGLVVAATSRGLLGRDLGQRGFFRQALGSDETVFSEADNIGDGIGITYARALDTLTGARGVIVVSVDMGKLEQAWSNLQEAVLVTDAKDRIILASQPGWKDMTLAEAMTLPSPPNAFQSALQATKDFAQNPPDAYVSGEAVLKTERSVPFGGWKIVAFTAYDSVRERVNGVLALEIMAFAILAALTFYLLSRRAWLQSLNFQRESAELRLLNARLSREIAERERVQKTLAVAEQSLAQSSKLAALGEMSAAVSHELNQPLAAMKTYLAGARLLLMRRRTDEALSSFQRIDDLIERMGAITRQLKSYARKGEEAFEPVDLRASLSSALAMMEPQLKARTTRIIRAIPRKAVMVKVDRLRLEQVLINLLRNALEATRETADPAIQLTLQIDEGDEAQARLIVADNGPGIEDLTSIFEPFYTTKKPGEGTGLGLAISSGIIADFGGRLTAQNAKDGTPGQRGGAVFTIQLPLIGAAGGGTGSHG